MLATGQSMVAVFNKLMTSQTPKEIHIAVVIAAPEGIEYLEQHLPTNCHLWVAALDEKLNEKTRLITGFLFFSLILNSIPSLHLQVKSLYS